jgi:hypothetical protein
LLNWLSKITFAFTQILFQGRYRRWRKIRSSIDP